MSREQATATNRLAIVAVLAAGLLAGYGAFTVTHNHRGSPLHSRRSGVLAAARQAPAPAPPAAANGTAGTTRAPDFDLRTIEGRTVHLSALLPHYKAVIVNFWGYQ